MKLVNSSRYDPARLSNILSFIVDRCRFAEHVTLVLNDVSEGIGPVMTNGLTNLRVNSRGMETVVYVGLSRDLEYPIKTMHVPEVGVVELQSWDEEVLFVMAHEFRHADQFLSAGPFEDDDALIHAAEVDAERFAYGLLLEWRHAHSRRAA